jgi:YD repeat-containing protein
MTEQKPIMSTLAITIALAIGTTAYGQTTTFHDSSGRVTGRAKTDTNGTTTYYDASGRVVGKASAHRGDNDHS